MVWTAIARLAHDLWGSRDAVLSQIFFGEPRMAKSSVSGKVGEKPGIRKRLKEGKSGKYRQAVERPNDADREGQVERWKATVREKVRVAAQEAADEVFGPAGMPWGTLFDDLETVAVAGGDLFSQSFMAQAAAQQAPAVPPERAVPVKDLERLVHRIGGERIAQRDAQTADYAQKPLMNKITCPLCVTPNAVSVSLDGGRQQLRSDALETDDLTTPASAAVQPPTETAAGATAADELAPACLAEAAPPVETTSIAEESDSLEEKRESTEGHWKYYNAGVLQTLSSVESAVDPCPEIPDCFIDRPRITKIAKEIQGTHTP